MCRGNFVGNILNSIICVTLLIPSISCALFDSVFFYPDSHFYEFHPVWIVCAKCTFCYIHEFNNNLMQIHIQSGLALIYNPMSFIFGLFWNQTLKMKLFCRIFARVTNFLRSHKETFLFFRSSERIFFCLVWNIFQRASEFNRFYRFLV